MYLGSDNYLGSTAYLGQGPNGDVPEPTGDETLIQWRDITLHGCVGRFTINALEGWDDLPDARTQWDPRPGQHGVFDAPVYSSERHIMVSGLCKRRDQRDALLRELKRALTFGPHAEELAITHAGRRLSVAARLVRFQPSNQWWGAGVFPWSAEWVAPDPFRYGQQRQVYTTLPELKGGLKFPLFTDGTGSGVSTSYAWTGTPGESTSTETVDGDPARTNLCANPSADYGVTVNWSGPATVTADSTRAHSGEASFRYDRSGGQGWRNEINVTEGVTYTYSAWVWAEPGSTFNVRITGTGFAATTGDEHVGTGAWQRVSMTATASSTGTMLVYPAYNLTTNVCWVDDILIEASASVGDYFDGDTPDESPWNVTGWLDFGEAGSSGRITLSNDGDADAHPTFTVRGPAPGGFTIANINTGRRIVSTTVVPAGSTLTIHTATGTAYLDGADRSGQLPVREWTPIPPGESYTFQFTAPTFTSAALVGSIRDTYW